MMIYFKWRVSSFADSLKSLYPFIPRNQPHVIIVEQKPSHLRSHSRRRKMMMIYSKWRVSWLTEITLSLHSPNQPQTTNADKNLLTSRRRNDDDLLQMKSVIFCWLTEITLSLHPPNQPHVTNADKNLATWGRIQGDTKDDDDLLQMKSIIFCWLTEITLSLPPRNQPHVIIVEQKPSHLRSHSRRRKMMMIYFKWRVSSFADSLKLIYPFIPPNQPHVTNAHKNRRKMVMIIYFKWRVSSFADSLKSLYPFIPQINPTS